MVLNLPIELQFVAALWAAVAAAFGIVVIRLLIAYARTREMRGADGAFRRAVGITGNWTIGIIVGVFSAVALGLVQFGDVAGMLIEIVVGHPYAVSNFGIAGIGAGALSGLYSLTASQFVGIALIIVGAVFLSGEIDDAI